MQYKLKILNLKCYLSDESDGDEIYIISNNEKIWPVDSNFETVTAETTSLNLEYNIEKGDEMRIELWDYDTFSANDHLGEITIEATAHGHFVNEFSKKGKDKSRYALEWEIG